jgi:SAM-dependent methyltransferase
LFLDVGSGSGIVASQLKRDFGLTAHACDLNESYLAKASPEIDRRMVYNIFDRNPEMVSRYDCVGAMDVIEHVKDDVGFLRAMQDHLKPGGLLVVNVPALNALHGRYDEAAGHLRRYDKRSLNAALTAAGLTDIEAGYWGLSLLPILIARNFYLRMYPGKEVIKHGFEPPGAFTNKILQLLRACETRSFASVPLGTSLMAVARRR